MKLSQTQKTILNLMNEGWVLSGWPHLNNVETGEGHYVRQPTFDILLEKKLIELDLGGGPAGYINDLGDGEYRLTDFGREALGK